MRLAVIVAPPSLDDHPTSPKAPPGLEQGFARAGFRTVVVASSPELEGDLERVLGTAGEEGDVVVYVAGRTKLDGEQVSLIVASNGGAELRVSALGEVAAAHEPRELFFIVELRHDGAADDAMLAAEHVDAIVRALNARARGWGVLVGVWAEASAATDPGAWPFTKFVLRVLDDPETRDERGIARASSVYERLRELPALNTFVQSFAYVKARIDFELVVPEAVEEGRGESIPPSSASFASAPALEPIVQLAEAAR